MGLDVFEFSLQTKLKNIFDMTKVSFDEPGESDEQECIFIDVSNAKQSIKDGRAYFKVSGKCHIVAPHDKLPFGFFHRKIKLADLADSKDFFFFDIEESAKMHLNLVKRSFSFVYFFNTQLNPVDGTIESITTEVQE